MRNAEAALRADEAAGRRDAAARERARIRALRHDLDGKTMLGFLDGDIGARRAVSAPDMGLELEEMVA